MHRCANICRVVSKKKKNAQLKKCRNVLWKLRWSRRRANESLASKHFSLNTRFVRVLAVCIEVVARWIGGDALSEFIRRCNRAVEQRRVRAHCVWRYCARVRRFDGPSIAFECNSGDKQFRERWRGQHRWHWRNARVVVFVVVVVVSFDAQRRRQIASQRAHSHVCAATVCCQRVRWHNWLCDSVKAAGYFVFGFGFSFDLRWMCLSQKFVASCTRIHAGLVADSNRPASKEHSLLSRRFARRRRGGLRKSVFPTCLPQRCCRRRCLLFFVGCFFFHSTLINWQARIVYT